MKISIPYNEISHFIRKRYVIDLQWKRIDTKTLEISYKPSTLIPSVNIILRVDAIRDDVIHFSYSCNKPIALLIAGAIGHVQNKISKGIEVDIDQKSILIYPKSLLQTQNFITHVTLTDIICNNENIDVLFMLKG